MSATATDRVLAELENEYVRVVTFRIDLNRDVVNTAGFHPPAFTGTALAAGTEIVIRSSMDWGSIRDGLLVEGGYDGQMLASRSWRRRVNVWSDEDGIVQSFVPGNDFTDSGRLPEGPDYMENGLEKYGNRTSGHARGQDWRRTLRLSRDVGPAGTFSFTLTMTSPLDWITRLPFVDVIVNPNVLPSSQYSFERQTHKLSAMVTLLDGGATRIT